MQSKTALEISNAVICLVFFKILDKITVCPTCQS